MMRAMPTTTPDNYKDNDTNSSSEGSNTQFGNIGKPNAKPEPDPLIKSLARVSASVRLLPQQVLLHLTC